MSELLRLGALEVTFALVFTVLALLDVAHLRRQSKQLMRRIEMSRLEANSLAELSAAHAVLQRRYSQASALIYLMGQFNQVMEYKAVLVRLSRGLSEFFAGDRVAIWIRRPGGNFELAAAIGDDRADMDDPDPAWLNTMLGKGSIVIRPAWQQTEAPWMAAPILDWRGNGLGVIVLTSHRRSAYAPEDRDFLEAVLGHAAMAIQNAARFETADRRSRLDPLTGLGNRGDFDRALHDALTHALLAAGSLSIVLADIDHFKQINDSRGHPEGDRVLRHVARLIAQSAGTPGRAFRIGGEEFAVLLAQAKAAAVSVAQLLCVRVGQEAFFDDDTRLTLSIGVSSLPEDGRDPAALMAAADQALYQAKAAGRNRVHPA